MTSSASEKSDEVLKSALAGVPRVAKVIAYMPPQERERAFAAAKQSYERTAQELGLTRAAARQWASTVLRRLKEEVAELQGTGPREAGNELYFPKIISARTDDETGPNGSKKEGS
jgi:DNA-directed RNA polymerase specialized sigma24 family protein